MTVRRSRRMRAAAQSFVEFALILGPLFLVLMAIIDFGHVYQVRISVANGARDAVRYASIHPQAWSGADPAASDTIEAVAQAIAGVGHIPNVLITAPTVAGIRISYLSVDSGTLVECGYYDPASGFVGLTVGATTYTAATCAKSGNVVRVDVNVQDTALTAQLAAFTGGQPFIIGTTALGVIE